MTNHQLPFLVWAFVAGCGSVDSNKPDGAVVEPGDFSLAVDMGSVTSPIAGSANVMVTVTRGSGFGDAIELTASGLPSGVAATFGASSLPSGTDATTVSLVIDRVAEPGTTEVTITGTSGSLTHSATVSLALTTLTVNGKVRNGTANTTIRIVGKDAVQSDASGNFVFTDVKVPYDIYVLGETGPNDAPIPSVNYYKGLTRSDPVVTSLAPYCNVGCLSQLPDNRSTTINGSRSGSGTNSDKTYLNFTATKTTYTSDTGTWSFPATWYTNGLSQTKLGRLLALQASRGLDDRPTSWYFGDSGDKTLTSGTPQTIDLALAPITAASLTGTITPPVGFGTPIVTLSQSLGTGVFLVWNKSTIDGTSTIPVLTGEHASLFVTAISGNAQSYSVYPALTATTDISMTIPPPAGIIAPEDNATNITLTTPLTFTTPPNQVFLVSIENNAVRYYVYTTSGSLTIPDVPERPLPAAAQFLWQVYGYAPFDSVDLAADPAELRNVSLLEASGSPHSFTSSAPRNFTTQ